MDDYLGKVPIISSTNCKNDKDKDSNLSKCKYSPVIHNKRDSKCSPIDNHKNSSMDAYLGKRSPMDNYIGKNPNMDDYPGKYSSMNKNSSMDDYLGKIPCLPRDFLSTNHKNNKNNLDESINIKLR